MPRYAAERGLSAMSTSSFVFRSFVRLIKTALGSALYAGLAFLGAGRLAWPRGWLYAAVFIAVSLVGTLIIQLANPSLLEARAKGVRKDTKPFDKRFYLLFLPLIVFYPLLAGLDAGRFAWAPLPGWTAIAGASLFVLGSVLGTWTMVVNAHAETTVRLQDEQHLVTGGPYRFVRHPMYLGTLIGLPGTALMLGSGWALVPMTVIVLLFVWRTAREDQTLARELAGYAAYSKTTRDRLLPGVW
jgi:protein-S-isoprenylcysteine O-methyltransferase Ste14